MTPGLNELNFVMVRPASGYWKGPDLSTVFRLNAVKFELVLFILFILHLDCPSVTSKTDPIRETRSKFTVTNPIRSDTFPVNNVDKKVHQQAAPPTLYHFW